MVAILVIEPTFRVLHLPYSSFFWWVHFPLFLSYGTFFALAWIYDGRVKNRSLWFARRHNAFGKWAQYCGLFTALTGDWLVYVNIWLHHASALR
jgi:hypothetical protein